MRSVMLWVVALATLLCASHPRTVASQAQAAETARVCCTADEYRQFDFWVGDWDIKSSDGDVVGRNRIARILDGCALSENWTGRTGSIGRSLNTYDRSTRRWHQTWVDNGGLLLRLDGGLEGDTMVLSGPTTAPDGRVTQQRISWHPRADGTVRQQWQSSTDGGGTWRTVFDGIYVRRTP